MRVGRVGGVRGGVGGGGRDGRPPGGDDQPPATGRPVEADYDEFADEEPAGYVGEAVEAQHQERVEQRDVWDSVEEPPTSGEPEPVPRPEAQPPQPQPEPVPQPEVQPQAEPAPPPEAESERSPDAGVDRRPEPEPEPELPVEPGVVDDQATDEDAQPAAEAVEAAPEDAEPGPFEDGFDEPEADYAQINPTPYPAADGAPDEETAEQRLPAFDEEPPAPALPAFE